MKVKAVLMMGLFAIPMVFSVASANVPPEKETDVCDIAQGAGIPVCD